MIFCTLHSFVVLGALCYDAASSISGVKMDQRKRTGRRGEELAAAHLAAKGYRIIARNWRCRAGELDIVAQFEDVLVFVEVRARQGDQFGPAEESITPAKQARLIELAQTYLQETATSQQPWRIDVVAIQLGSGLPHINHLENAVGW